MEEKTPLLVSNSTFGGWKPTLCLAGAGRSESLRAKEGSRLLLEWIGNKVSFTD